MNPSGFNRFAPRHSHFHNKYQPFCSNFMVRGSWVGGWHIGTGKKTPKKKQGDNSHSSLVGLFPAWSVDDRASNHTWGRWLPTRNPVANSTEDVVAKIPLFYGSVVVWPWDFWLEPINVVWLKRTCGFFSLAFIVRWYRSWSVLKKQLFWKSHSKNKNKNKNTSWTLLLMIHIFLRVTLEKAWWSQSNDWNMTKFSTTDVTDGQHLFSRPTNSFLCVILGQHATKTTMSGNTKFAFLHIQWHVIWPLATGFTFHQFMSLDLLP